MAKIGGEAQVVPDSVMKATAKTLTHLDELKRHLLDFLDLADPDVLSEMPPLQRARALLVFAKATTMLFALKLRCAGVRPSDHSVNTELERLSLYQEKLERFNDWNKAPLRPSTTLNHQAATRFIEHSLTDLTPEQRQGMRAISQGEGKNSPFEKRFGHKKQKCQSVDKKSIQEAAQEFLMKASLELLGPKGSLVKGPLRKCDSDDEDGLVE